jgi:hypothetical protein
MNIDQIDAELDKQKPKSISVAAQYGVMGVCLGKELLARLKEHAAQEKLPMSRIIKTLVEVYLREKYSKF